VYPERGVLLLVDELLKAQGPNQSQSGTVGVILTQIGMCLDTLSSAQFNSVVSSLDPRPFTSVITGYFSPTPNPCRLGPSCKVCADEAIEY
jgi:hypothetical protein